MYEITSFSSSETEEIGKKFAKTLKGTEIIALYGDLGAGKTAFVRGVAKGLGIDDGVSSPTFAIVNEYHGKFNIYHFDMYRINTLDDLYSIGFFDYIENGILLIEWSENIDSILDSSTIKITISKCTNENSRILTFENAEKF